MLCRCCAGLRDLFCLQSYYLQIHFGGAITVWEYRLCRIGTVLYSIGIGNETEWTVVVAE